jgi:hypothetical protein
MSTVVKVVVALLAGFAAFVLFVPTSGAAEFCYSLLAFRVPCEGEFAMGAGVVTAAVVGVGLWLASRPTRA